MAQSAIDLRPLHGAIKCQQRDGEQNQGGHAQPNSVWHELSERRAVDRAPNSVQRVSYRKQPRSVLQERRERRDRKEDTTQ